MRRGHDPIITAALHEEAGMCLLCDAGRDGAGMARRGHVLRLLALIEHPDALPAEDALRIAGEILALARAEPAARSCDAVPPPDADRQSIEHGRPE